MLKDAIGKKIKDIIDNGDNYTIVLSDNSKIIISQQFSESRYSTLEGNYYLSMEYIRGN